MIDNVKVSNNNSAAPITNEATSTPEVKKVDWKGRCVSVLKATKDWFVSHKKALYTAALIIGIAAASLGLGFVIGTGIGASSISIGAIGSAYGYSDAALPAIIYALSVQAFLEDLLLYGITVASVGMGIATVAGRKLYNMRQEPS